MVIATSDSNSTLVSLDRDGLKQLGPLHTFPSSDSKAINFRLTALNLPVDDADDSYWDEQLAESQPLYLPSNDRIGVDESMKCIPSIMDTRDALLAHRPVQFESAKSQSSRLERLLYVGQGELAHCTPFQNDILFSDKATTCHILALRSTCETSLTSQPLCSLTHIDGTSYEDCIRAAVQQHALHHEHNNIAHDDDDDSFAPVAVDIHVMGGFEDGNGASREISNWLFHLLADLAEEHRDTMVMTLRTACITSMNSDGRNGPLGRGLALNCRTGRVFLCHSSPTTVGPQPILRSARLWMRPQTLNIIFTQHDDTLMLRPFCFSPFQGLNQLLPLPDDILIQYCSTSPECEEDDFCTTLRSTLQLLRDVSDQSVFGTKVDQPLVYHRKDNVWCMAS